MSIRKAPYLHADGSNCYTKNCSRGNSSQDAVVKDSFIKEWFKPLEAESSLSSGVTYLDVIASPEDFALAVEEGRVSRQRHPDYPYSIYKYSQMTTYKHDWDDVTMASRGLVVDDETGEIIARPFSKFFNHNEADVPFDLMRGEISVSEKLDGSLGITYMTPDGLQITTAGGFQSPQGAHATRLYREKYEGNWERRDGVTYLYEIIYPENRIVLDYGDEDDIYLIGAVNIKTGRSIPLSQITEWKWKRATEHTNHSTLDSVVNGSERSNHEGYVIHYVETDARVKYKHDEYLTHHRFATGINSRRIWEKLRDSEDMSEWLATAPEEFEGYINTTRDSLQKDYDARVSFIKSSYDSFMGGIPEGISPKDFAERVKNDAPKDLAGYFFSLKNHGKFHAMGEKNIWEYIKPPAERSFWSMNNGIEDE